MVILIREVTMAASIIITGFWPLPLPKMITKIIDQHFFDFVELFCSAA
jgi:hypothetical protein